MSIPAPARRKRPWWKVAGTLGLAALLLLAAFPWLLARGPLRSWVVSGLGRALAPGRLEFETLHVSWMGPTRLEHVSLFDPKGEEVIKAPSIVIDRTLVQWILGDRSPASLTLEGPSLALNRRDDGSINIVEALRGVIARPDPTRDLTIRVVNGSLRYLDPVLAEPVLADSADLTIHIPYAPAPMSWSIRLARGEASLESQGEFDAWLSKGGPPRKPDLQIGVVGKRWPFVARTGEVEAAGRLEGSLDFVRKRGRWAFTGDARLDSLQGRGKRLRGDTLAFEKLEAGWDVAEVEDGWKIRRLSASSPLGQIKTEGQLGGPDGSGKQRIEGQLDLAEIARQLPHALHLREGLTVKRGKARVVVDLVSALGETAFDVEATVSDLQASDLDRAISLNDQATFQARFMRKGDESRVERFSVRTSFLDASATGNLEAGVNLSGSCDLGGLRKQLGEWVDLGGLDLAGRAELTGTYLGPSTTSPQRYENRLTATIKDLRLEGGGPCSIRRDSTRVEFSAGGPAGKTGLPNGWSSVGVLVRSGKTEGRIHLKSGDGPGRLMASASLPWNVGDRTRMATLDLQGSPDEGRKLDVQALTIALESTEKGPKDSRIALSMRGSLDLANGDCVLEPSTGPSNGLLAIDPEGLRISGLGQGLGSLRFDGGLSGDLSGLDAILADATVRPPMGLSGRWSALGNARGDADGLMVVGRFDLVEAPGSTAKSSRPSGLALRAHYSPSSDRIDLSEFTVRSPYGTIDASGKLEEASDERSLDLKGTLSPDFAAINALLAAKVEPGSRIDGKPRGFRASGTLGDGSKSWANLDAEAGFDLSGADIYGMKFGPSPVVLRAKRGHLAFDPISTTLNEGHIRLEPEIDLEAQGGPVLRLAKNSGIREARINDEVSKRVLAYVAPILDQATTASGLVSVDLDHAEFPIGQGRGRQAKVEGAVVFQDVQFNPGPLAGEILAVIGRRDLSLKLDQPVTLTIADGRVNQRGMSIPLGELTRIELNGWVDFDRNIALNATLPVTPAMLGNTPMLADIIAGTKVRLPISGTLDRPAVDREAFASNLQDLGKSLLTRGATRGAMELLMRLARPRDPDAPPPPPRPSPEERKAKRQEKKAIRRGEIPPPGVEPPRR